MRIKMNNKLVLGIVAGLFVGGATIAAVVCVFMINFVSGDKTVIKTDVAKYEEDLSEDDLNSGFIVFPEHLPESASNADYYFYCKDIWDSPAVELFLQCNYDDEDYNMEIERLDNTKKKYGSKEYKLLRDKEERFPYEVYIAIDGHCNSYEYALLTDDNQITYIYTSYMYSDELKKIDKGYLPVDFDKRQDELEAPEGFNIYLSNVDTINGKVDSWEYDYTRDERVEVLENYWVSIGYNRFGACTYLDENNNRIIKNCYYSYYNSLDEYIFGGGDEIIYNELEGFGFKDIQCNTDKTKIYITYIDGNEEKTKEYDVPEIK